MISVTELVGQVHFHEFRTTIQELASTEGRLLFSGIVLVAAILFAALLAPYLIRWAGGLFHKRFPEGRAVTAIDVVSDYIPTTISGFVLRIVQVLLLGITLIALLVIWGLIDVAARILEFVGFSLPLLTKVIVTGLIFLFGYIGSDLLENSIKELSNGADRVTDHQQEIVVRLGNLGILVFAVTAVLTLWGLNLSGLLVGAGFLGIVVGMAARQTLGSMIAGFVLMFSRPFTIGDWIEVGDHQGIVTDITIMNTRMHNFDGESIIIPNDTVSNQALTNRSEQGHLRIRVEVGIDYDADPEYAERLAIEEMESIESIADSPQPAAVPTRFGDSAVVLELRFWIDRPTPPRRWRATRSVIHNVKERFEDAGIAIPFPQRSLSSRTSDRAPDLSAPENRVTDHPQTEPSAED